MLQYSKSCALMNSAPLSESIPSIGNGNCVEASSMASSTQRAALFFTERLTSSRSRLKWTPEIGVKVRLSERWGPLQ